MINKNRIKQNNWLLRNRLENWLIIFETEKYRGTVKHLLCSFYVLI